MNFSTRFPPGSRPAAREVPRIVHVIGSLEVGGAERGLCNLVGAIGAAQADMRIVTLLAGGPLAGTLPPHVQLDCLSLPRRWPDPRALPRLAAYLRHQQPDLVVTWMYHANLLGGLAAAICGVPVVWNIRHTTLDPGRSKRLTRWIARGGGWASRRLPAATVYVAHSSRQQHLARGYEPSRAVVIPNGFDIRRFQPDAGARAELRLELGIDPAAEVIGLVGRFHPDKDHAAFLAAAGHVLRQRPATKFLLCGAGVTADNAQIRPWISAGGLEGATRLLGPRADVPRVLAALDVAVCSSLTEAFPQSVGEAMACGVPCAVTDVGDAARLVADCGRVVPPGQPERLAQACMELLALGPQRRRELGLAARQRIGEQFSLSEVAARHWRLWRHVSLGHRAASSRAGGAELPAA